MTDEPRTELRAIAALALPIALAHFGLTMMGMVEVAILGRAAPAELGGASIGRSISFTALALGLGASSALEPLASQALGAREPRTAWRAFVVTLATCALLAIPCGAIAIASTWLLPLAGVKPEIVGPARRFVLAQTPSLACASVYLAAKTYLQAHGKTQAPLVATGVGNVVNFVVCGALVLGDDGLRRLGLPAVGLRPLGALGAGLANTVSNVVLAAWVLVPAWKTKPKDATGASGAEAAHAEEISIGKVLRIGMPIGLHLLAEIGVFSVVAVLAGRLGEVAISAHQIAISLASFTFMGVLGISGATAVRVGYAIGEGRPPMRAGVLGIGLGAAFMIVCGIVFLVAPRALVSVFTHDARIVELGASLLFVAAAFQLFDGIQGVAAGALRGAGDVRFPFVANVAAHWLVGFPLAIFLGFRMGWGARGLWWGLLVGLAGVATSLTWRFVTVARGRIARI